jgi:hypothetical protein
MVLLGNIFSPSGKEGENGIESHFKMGVFGVCLKFWQEIFVWRRVSYLPRKNRVSVRPNFEYTEGKK